jgi:hypothetical protein
MHHCRKPSANELVQTVVGALGVDARDLLNETVVT